MGHSPTTFFFFQCRNQIHNESVWFRENFAHQCKFSGVFTTKIIKYLQIKLCTQYSIVMPLKPMAMVKTIAEIINIAEKPNSVTIKVDMLVIRVKLYLFHPNVC